jgi:AcrR family transcriptional regulator/DNA-binding MarR family transcriptional regulator
MRTMARGRIPMRRPGTPGPRGGGVFVTELQRARLLDAAFAVVAEDGYRRMTARRVSGRAGVSNKTFYDLFTDREDCFLAAFDHAVEELAAVVLPAWEGEKEWSARIRAGLGALLDFLDGEPALRQLVFVEALGAGQRVLERRAQVLKVLERAIDQGRTGVKAGREPAPLTAEGVIGAAFSVIHTRLLEQNPEPLTELLNPLMAVIVLPYRGQAAATRELARPAPLPGRRGASRSRTQGAWCATHASDRGRRDAPPIAALDFRLTIRTHMVLSAVAELSGRGADPNNREVSDAAGVSDQGQISKLLSRLEGHGLLENTGGSTQGVPRAWRLTPHGEEIVRIGWPRGQHPAGHVGSSGASR